jgi:hypothetical protein
MVFVESPWFDAWRAAHLDDVAFRALQSTLLADPLIGDLIPGGRGLRKMRIGLQGRGKRGGARLIYYYWTSRGTVYLLYAFAKNERADLTRSQLRQLGALLSEERDNE